MPTAVQLWTTWLTYIVLVDIAVMLSTTATIQPPVADANNLLATPSVVALGAFVTFAAAGFLAKWAFGHIIGQWQQQVIDLRAEVKSLTADQIIVKTEYVSKEEFLRVTTRFEFHMDRLGEKIDKLLER